jgi:hypothetical protein
MRFLKLRKKANYSGGLPRMEGYIPSPLVIRGILRAISLVTSPQVYAY